MKEILEVIDKMIKLSEALSPASNVFLSIEKYFRVNQRTPIQKAKLISLIKKRMSEEKDVGMLVMNFARHMEQGNYFKPGINIKNFKNDMEKSIKRN